MEDKSKLLEIYTAQTGRRGLFARSQFNRIYGRYVESKSYLSKLFDDNLSENDLFEAYLGIIDSIKPDRVKEILGNENVSSIADLIEEIKGAVGVKKLQIEDSEKLGPIIQCDKFGLTSLDEDGGITTKTGFLTMQPNINLLKDKDKSQIENLYGRYMPEIFDAYINEHKGAMYFSEQEDFEAAMADKDNEKHAAARLVSIKVLEDLLKVYSFEEMCAEEDKVKNEIKLGLFSRMLSEKNMPLDSQKKYTNNRESYAKLADTWEESDLETYENLPRVTKYMGELLKSENVSAEQRETLKEAFVRFNAISNMKLEDVVTRQDQVAEVMSEAMIEYEVAVREDFLESIYTLDQKDVGEQTIKCGDEDIQFKGTIINGKKQMGTMLLHFFRQEYDDVAVHKRNVYQKRIIQEVTSRRGLLKEVDANDPEVVSAMQHYESVLSNRTVVNEMVDSVWTENADGSVTKKQDRDDLEHICAQTISAKKAKNITSGSYALLFDKNGVESESIINTSVQNLESNRGIYNAARKNKSIATTSAPFSAIIDAEGNPRNPNTEIDMERNSVKASAICFFGRIPLSELERQKFIEVKAMAEGQGVELVFIDTGSLEREYQNNLTQETSR